MEVFISILQSIYLFLVRFIFIFLCALIVIHIKRRIFESKGKNDILAVLDIENGTIRLPITSYETTIGRSKACDVVIPLPTISRQHAVLSMNEQGYWRIADTGSRGGIYVNDQELTPETKIGIHDKITMSGMSMMLKHPSTLDPKEASDMRKSQKMWITRMYQKFFGPFQKEGSIPRIFVCLNIFQILACIQLMFSTDPKYYAVLIGSFVFVAVLPWIYMPIGAKLGITDMTAEALAFFLTTLGICTTASVLPSSLIKQDIAIVLGMVIFCVMCVVLRYLNHIMKMRKYAMILSLVILAVNIVIGSTINGQKNWIRLGGITIQPSEFVKILFVFASAATLEWLLTTKNLTLLTVYSVACIGFLVLMGDFGTALIFFFGYLVLIFMTSGDVRAIVLSCVSAGMGAMIVLRFKPYITNRFGAWRHVWEHVHDTGFQQTRALMAVASGGLLGMGAGNGTLKKVFAADTDIVFGVLVEEWGLIIAFLAILCYIFLLVAAIRSNKTARSSYYVIAACGAASMLLFQTALNIFGTTDILPLTGVTLPFISNGGSSMAASWGMLSFITAALNFSRPKFKRITEPRQTQTYEHTQFRREAGQ